VETFLKQNCHQCHDADVHEGGLDLTQFALDSAKPEALARWVRAYDRVQAGEMPPKGEPRPGAQEWQKFLASLGEQVRNADLQRIAAEGRVPARRLTRLEYERTIHDLLGIDVPLIDLLQEDPRADGFDKVSTAQQISHFQLDQYLNVADIALDAAWERALGPAKRHRTELGWPELKTLSTRQREPVPRPEHKDVVSWSPSRAFSGRMPPTKVRESGWYRISLGVSAVNPPADGQVWCSVHSGVCAAAAPTLFWIGSFAAVEEQREVQFEAWIEAGHILEVRPHDSAHKKNKFGAKYATEQAQSAGLPGVAIKWISLERISRGPDAAPLRELLFPGVRVDASPGGNAALISANPKIDAARLVQAFASRAFRRPLTDAEAAPYVALAEHELDGGASLLDALRVAFRGVLTSPRFLYMDESPGRLPAHALAERLSYFLWSTMPDDELRAAADAGRLTEANILHQQVERMLGDPKAEAFIHNFTDQWLNLTEIDATTPDSKLYPEFDEVLKYAMLDETHAFFRELVTSDRSATNVIDSSFGFMNSRLARHYGIPWPGGEGMRQVTLRPEDRRGGLITQASILKVTANGTTTSPVVRGVWMMDRIMGQSVPPVPANVPAIEPDIRGATTIREQLAKHREIETCAACHVKIDPPGFALENYDVIGLWRDEYRAAVDGFKPAKAGKDGKEGGWQPGPQVDPSYTTADGRAFKSLAEFKEILLSDADKIARNLAAKLMTYGTGAGISFSDRQVLDDIVAKTRKQEYGVRSLIHAVIASDSFLNK
jgi:hypothetical protein